MQNDSKSHIRIDHMLWNYLLFNLFLVFFYNFGWKDYGEASLTGLLDMVKVMAFSVSEGKVAIHCHAGQFIYIFLRRSYIFVTN